MNTQEAGQELKNVWNKLLDEIASALKIHQLVDWISGIFQKRVK